MKARPALVSWILLAALTAPAGEAPGRGRGRGRGRPVPPPPPGIVIPSDERAKLETGARDLSAEIDRLRSALTDKPAFRALLPDVEIYHKAVDWALRYDEFYRTNETQVASDLLRRGMDRARALAEGQAPWTTATGLVVRAYRSRIDGSIQPYGLLVPPSYSPGSPHTFRLDFWFHGRGEQLTELSFVNDRHRSYGEFRPPNSFVVHLYGRYCNANRFAGEMDLFEVLEEVRRQYPIDENRIVVRGFSMGGAACWQFATHHAGLWAAAAPGAGFSETSGFLRIQPEAMPPDHERVLWHWYDSTDYAVNLFNCPTVAYSGEIDGQKQAADMMAEALAREGMALTHIIGPQTPHRYHPQSKIEIDRRIDQIVARGRDPVPDRVKFATWTLRYNQMLWVTLNGMARHWEEARIEAALDRAGNTLTATTTNITSVTFAMAPGQCPFDPTRKVAVLLDHQRIEVSPPDSDRSWAAAFVRRGGAWEFAGRQAARQEPGLAKRHGLQGPIDDAFMDSFIMVRPTGQPMNERVGAWTASEQEHASVHWRKQFRGDAPVKSDQEITEDDISRNHLVLWGDPSSNRVLARILDRLPIQWSAQGLRIGEAQFAADRHVPAMIFPNPLNPERYVVLNSGFTFREYDYLNNARQTAKLPDYAVIDVGIPATDRAPGGIVSAGFFNEQWEIGRK